MFKTPGIQIPGWPRLPEILSPRGAGTRPTKMALIAMDRPGKLIVRFCTNSKIEFCVCGAEVALYISHLLPQPFFCLPYAMDTSMAC